MRHPHPWLARFAWLGIAFGLLGGLAAIGTTLLPMGWFARWYGAEIVSRWGSVSTPSEMRDAGRLQCEELATLVAGPAAWVAAAYLLRLTATGRLRPADAPAGLDQTLPIRIRAAVEHGAAYKFDGERQLGWEGNTILCSAAGLTTGPAEDSRRLAGGVCAEGGKLFRVVRVPGVLFFTCGIVYCLASARRDPEDE